MLTVIRWLLVPLVGLLGYLSGLAVTIALNELFIWLCPAELLDYEMCVTCTAPWFYTAKTLSFFLGASVGAVLAVLLSSLVAPAHQGVIGAIAFAKVAYTYINMMNGEILCAAGALVCGAVTLRWCWVRAKARAASSCA